MELGREFFLCVCMCVRVCVCVYALVCAGIESSAQQNWTRNLCMSGLQLLRTWYSAIQAAAVHLQGYLLLTEWSQAMETCKDLPKILSQAQGMNRCALYEPHTVIVCVGSSDM